MDQVKKPRDVIIVHVCDYAGEYAEREEKKQLSEDTFECFVRKAEVETVVTERAFLTRAFREAEEDAVEEAEDEGGSVADCRGGRGRDVEAVLVPLRSLGAALSCLPEDPPPLFDDLCLPTFSSSIWVSAVPCARPKSTSAYLHKQEHRLQR